MRKRKNVLIYNRDPNSIVYEEFERIRLNIEFTAYENNSNAFVFTSPNKKEGKTIITANLAISLANKGRKVLLIDANVRNPMIHELFKIKNTIGLTNFLIGQKSLLETINQTPVMGLKIMTSGPVPLSTEKLFKSKAMDHLMTTASSHFDYILFDTAPVLEGNDAKIISNKCHGAYLIITNGKTEEEDAKNAKKMLEISNARLLGVLFNKKKRSFSLKRTISEKF